MKNSLKFLFATIIALTVLLCLAACAEPEHTHVPKKVAAKAADCTNEGNIEYYACEGCPLLFSDAACTKETAAAAVKLSAKGHTPAEDDGDCTTAVKCSVCEAETTAAKEAHIPEEDDGDCTTAVKCKHCDETVVSKKLLHKAEADDGTCLTAVKCSRCETVITEAREAHEQRADDGDCLTAVKCKHCNYIFIAAEEAHTPEEDDGDCTTAVKCAACSKNVTPAKAAHTPEADDGNCLTAVKCANCEQIATPARDAHVPADDDGTCLTAAKCANCEQIAAPARDAHTDMDFDGTCDECPTPLDYLIDSETKTFYAYTAEGLYYWAEESYTYRNLVLKKDIVLPSEFRFDLDKNGETDSNWKPVMIFETVDGEGHSIRGITLGAHTDLGFCSDLRAGGIIKDLFILDINITSEATSMAGAIVASCSGTILGCGASGTISKGANAGNVGGIVGQLSGGSIIGCHSDIHFGEVSAGGIVGQMTASTTENSIIGCYFTGSISSTEYAGSGIVNNSYGGSLIAVYSAGAFSSPHRAIGSYIKTSAVELKAIYWSSETEGASACNQDAQEYCIEVDGEALLWADAMTEMNAALADAGVAFRYAQNTGADAATRPLILVKTSNS